MRRLPLILSQSWDGPDGRHYTWFYTEGQRERWFVDGEEISHPPQPEWKTGDGAEKVEE